MAVYSCAIKHEYLGQNVVNVIGFARQDTLGAETVTEAQVVANQVSIAWKARVLGQMASAVRFIEVEARGMFVPAVAGLSASGSQAGGIPSANAVLPSFAAAKVILATNTPGRAGRGRTGIAGLVEGDTEAISGNLLTAAKQNSLGTAFAGFVTDLAALTPTIFPVVISRYLGTGADGKPIRRPGGPIASPVVSNRVAPELGTRVSRLR